MHVDVLRVVAGAVALLHHHGTAMRYDSATMMHLCAGVGTFDAACGLLMLHMDPGKPLKATRRWRS